MEIWIRKEIKKSLQCIPLRRRIEEWRKILQVKWHLILINNYLYNLIKKNNWTVSSGLGLICDWPSNWDPGQLTSLWFNALIYEMEMTITPASKSCDGGCLWKYVKSIARGLALCKCSNKKNLTTFYPPPLPPLPSFLPERRALIEQNKVNQAYRCVALDLTSVYPSEAVWKITIFILEASLCTGSI